MLEPAFATVAMALCQYRYLDLTRFKDAYVFCAILAITHPEGRTPSVDTDVDDYASCTLRMLRRLQIMVAIRMRSSLLLYPLLQCDTVPLPVRLYKVIPCPCCWS